MLTTTVFTLLFAFFATCNGFAVTNGRSFTVASKIFMNALEKTCTNTI